MSYKSKHTGAQVDEAVSKVLNGEVGGGADWNAQQGEAGYIENRPFYTEYSNFKLNVGDELDNLDFYVSLKKNEYEYKEYIFEIWGNNRFRYGDEVNIYASGGTKITIKNDDGFFSIINKGPFSSNNECIEMLKECLRFELVTEINEKYLPNTVLKTTPQTLSDTDKNQALANLGIDPVVLKYMINPVVIDIEENLEVPDDLHNIIWEDGYLKNIALKTLLVRNATTNSVFSGIEGDALFDGDDVYVYDPETHSFTTDW